MVLDLCKILHPLLIPIPDSIQRALQILFMLNQTKTRKVTLVQNLENINY